MSSETWWSAGESNPVLMRARQPYSRPTRTPLKLLRTLVLLDSSHRREANPSKIFKGFIRLPPYFPTIPDFFGRVKRKTGSHSKILIFKDLGPLFENLDGKTMGPVLTGGVRPHTHADAAATPEAPPPLVLMGPISIFWGISLLFSMRYMGTQK